MKSLKNFLNLFSQKYQEGLEESMRGSEFVFYYKLHKTSLNRR